MERVKKAFNAYLAKKKEVEERNKERINKMASLNEITRDFFGNSNTPMKDCNYKDFSVSFGKNGIIIRKNDLPVVSSIVDDEFWDYLLTTLLSIINSATKNL